MSCLRRERSVPVRNDRVKMINCVFQSDIILRVCMGKSG